MRANGNLKDVTAKQGGSGGMLAPGGYACLIHAVVDGTEEASPYVGLVLNVLDPKTKKLLNVEAVEQTSQNKGFSYQDVDGGEQQLAGKWVGVVFRRYLYVPKRGKHKGEQREGVELSYVLPAADAIAGNFDPRLAERRDARPEELRGTPYLPEQAPASPSPAPAPASGQDPVYADEDIPF